MLYSILLSFAFQRILCAVAQDATPTDAASAVSTACGDIIAAAEEDITNNIFWADEVYDCLISVPLNVDVALRFLNDYNTTLQFQSTLAYLKDPPAEYQQPAVDVLQGLEVIRQNLTSGFFTNQYDFEVALQTLVYSMHDDHVALETGILSAFTFGSPYDIMSLSIDGRQAPQLYLAADIYDSQEQGYTPSPVISINDEDATSYLSSFASGASFGRLEPQADWNNLMYTPVQDILGTVNTFGWEVPFYPGDGLNFTFANGSTLETFWIAIYQNYYRTGPLTTGGDFYNYFVLGFLPASFTGPDLRVSSTDSEPDQNITEPAATSWIDSSSAYPYNPDVVQPDLSVTGGGFLTGYFLNSSSTAVLSVPSFQEFGEAVGTFSATVLDFIQRAQTAGLDRIVIDLQQNAGGTPLLAFDMFAQFFPNIEPFAGSRRRSHDLGNVLGAAVTDFWSSLTPDDEVYNYSIYHDLYAADEWVITNRINADSGELFSSWQEYQGPINLKDDAFSLTERYNLSDPIFDSAAFDGWAPAGFDGTLRTNPPPFPAENIVLLTDGACSSSCALFVEMMSHQAGVRTVVIGGQPASGPMQAASGSRGASAYSSDILESEYELAIEVNETAAALLPAPPTEGMFVSFAGFNLRDQIRKGETTPLQFKYEAADCRIYYTLANALNMTQLWLDAATATWDDPSFCIAGSQGYTTSANSTTPKAPAPPPPPMIQTSTSANLLADDDLLNGLADGLITISANKFAKCTGTCRCTASGQCPDGVTFVSLCDTTCSSRSAPCGGGQGMCVATTQYESKFQGKIKGRAIAKQKTTHFSCVPIPKARFPGCPGVGAAESGGYSG